MCDYCRETEVKSFLSEHGFELTILTIDGKKLIDVDFYGFDESGNTDVYINFCPMCGRKLKED